MGLPTFKLRIQISLYKVNCRYYSSSSTNLELNLNFLFRTFQNAIAEMPRDEVEANMAKLKQQKEALVRVRALVPVKLHQYRQLLVQHESLESGQKEISSWLDKAEDALRTIGETRRSVKIS